ncbi:MAG: hypothetical protein IJM09_00655, partial [Neisseriaceae bacterium]|nr:hypothetical protein [Neisseriaceae bacterium]
MSLYEESNQFRAELEQQVENVDIREITQLPNFKNWFNSKKAHSKCYDYDLPKLFYRTLNSIDNLDNIVNGNEQSRFVGEYFTDDLDTALTYVEHLEKSKVLIGFLNIQNPAIIDCKGAGWNEIRQNASVTEQLAYFEYLGFNEKPDNFEENRAYPIDLRNDEKDEGISFFLQIKTINKDTTPSFIKITAPQYYQNDRSFRKTKFINLDMLGYGTPSLFNDIGTTNFWATNLAHRHRFDSVIFENLNDDGGRGATLFEKSVKKRKMQGTVVCAFDRENSYFKHANNHGDFNPDDRRIFYSLFEIEQDFKQELKTEKDKTMQQTQTTADNGGFSYPQMAFEDKKSVLQAVKKEIQAVVDKMNTDLYDDYYKPQERQGDFIYDTSKSPYPIVIGGEVTLQYPLLLDENGNVQYEIIKPKPLTINRLLRYQVEVSTHRGDKTVWRGMRFNNADEFEYAVSQIQEQHDNYNAGRMFAKPDDPKDQKNPYWAIINDNQPYWQEIQAAFDKYVPVLQYITTAATGFIKDEQKQAEFDALSDEHKAFVRQFSGNLEQENQTMQQTQATQQTAAQGGFSLPKNPENTVNYDLTGLPEFSGSVSAYFNNPKRQELVLAFLKTAERSKDLRSQVFLGIPYEEQKQFDRIVAFSPLELSAILDCKPEFANNLREYMAVVEDFERNHQQKLEDFKKALHDLKISPKYQAATIRNRIFDENDLRKEYIDGGKAFAFTKTGEITNGDRLKQVIANAIETIAPAVKYSMSQTEFWQERDDKAFIKQSQIRDLLRSQMSFPAEMVEVKTLHQIWNDDRDMHDTISKSTAGFFMP